MQNNVAAENFKVSNPYLALRPQLHQRNKKFNSKWFNNNLKENM